VGLDFVPRGRGLDEERTMMRKLWGGQVVKHDGEFFRFKGIACLAPARPVEILCGGDAPPAMRRTARDGSAGNASVRSAVAACGPRG